MSGSADCVDGLIRSANEVSRVVPSSRWMVYVDLTSVAMVDESAVGASVGEKVEANASNREKGNGTFWIVPRMI